MRYLSSSLLFILSTLFISTLFTASVVIPTPSRAAQFSGHYLLQVCGSDKKGKELLKGGHIACQAYIAGVVDYHNLIKSLGTAPSVNFCIPQEKNLSDLQSVVGHYIFKHKEDHDKFIASPGVALALFDAFPCAGK